MVAQPFSRLIALLVVSGTFALPLPAQDAGPRTDVGAVKRGPTPPAPKAPYLQTIGLSSAEVWQAAPQPPAPAQPPPAVEVPSALEAQRASVPETTAAVEVSGAVEIPDFSRQPVGVVEVNTPFQQFGVQPANRPEVTGFSEDIDFSASVKLGDLVPSAREALYRRAITRLDYPKISVRELIQELATLSDIEIMVGDFEDKTVSLKVRRNPFVALEQVVENLGMGLVNRNGIFLVTAVDKTTLSPRIYRFQHIHLDREFSFREPVDTGSTGAMTGGGSTSSYGGAPMSPMGAMGTGGGTGGLGMGTYEKVTNRANTLSPRAASDRAKDNFILDRIEGYLNAKVSLRKPSEQKGILSQTPPEETENTSLAPIYDPDSNTLHCVTTDERWGWVTEFLDAIDQEQYNIQVELQFVTTSKNDHRQRGVNWAGGERGGFGTGIAFNLEGKAPTTTTTSSGTNGTLGSDVVTSGGNPISFGPIDNLTTPSAILTASALQAKLRLYAAEGLGKTSKKATFIAENNREVVWSLTQNRPVAVPSSTTNNTGGGGSVVSAGMNISNEEVGIVVRVLPQVVRGGAVRTHAKVEISNIVGGIVINSIEYPEIQNSRINSSPVMMAGCTAELGGLEQVITNKTREKIPLLGDIPILGFMFGDLVKAKDTSSLNLLLTIRMIDKNGNEVVFDEDGTKRIIKSTGPRQKDAEALMQAELVGAH